APARPHPNTLSLHDALPISPWNGTATSPTQSGLASPPRRAYHGETTRTSCPSAASAAGNAPATSPRPPALLYGATSEAANRTRMNKRLGRRDPYGPLSDGCVYFPVHCEAGTDREPTGRALGGL